MIIKTGDNLKQEQFALQLIYQFDQIFKQEGVNLILRPYEVISLGPTSGIIEMVKDSITIDSLLRHLHENYRHIGNLR
jgi:phosphatidylinositol kinase/protein kinase (PI-3  family)